MKEPRANAQDFATELAPHTRFLLLGVSASHARMIKKALRDRGATVNCAELGSGGWRFIQDNGYDVILVALGTRPSGNRAEIAFCRRHCLTAGIVALVPERKVAQIVRVIDAGADDCVTIPFHRKELLVRLFAVARRVLRSRPE